MFKSKKTRQTAAEVAAAETAAFQPTVEAEPVIEPVLNAAEITWLNEEPTVDDAVDTEPTAVSTWPPAPSNAAADTATTSEPAWATAAIWTPATAEQPAWAAAVTGPVDVPVEDTATVEPEDETDAEKTEAIGDPDAETSAEAPDDEPGVAEPDDEEPDDAEDGDKPADEPGEADEQETVDDILDAAAAGTDADDDDFEEFTNLRAILEMEAYLAEAAQRGDEPDLSGYVRHLEGVGIK